MPATTTRNGRQTNDDFLNDEPEVVEAHPLAITESLMRGEIDVQIATAKRYPRSIKRFISEATDMSCLDEETAAECLYALPRDGRNIEGPSARFAEIVASAWGNCRAGARVISEDDRFVTAQGAFFDLERNVAITYEVKRRITNKYGEKYSDDMITVTSNAACSIALRNAVFKGVPKAYWARAFERARTTAIGDAETISARAHKMIDYFRKMGVQPDQVLAVVDCEGIEDIGNDELITLKGLATAIKEGDTTIDQAFKAHRPGPDAEKPRNGNGNGKTNGNGAAGVAEKLARARAAQAKAQAQAKKPAEEQAEPDPAVDEHPTDDPAVDEAPPESDGKRDIELLWTDAVEAQAEAHQVSRDQAEQRLVRYIKSLFGADHPRKLTADQARDVKAKAQAGQISMPKK